MSGERNPNYGLSPSVDESYNGITTSVIPLIKKQKQLNKLYSEKNQQLASILITFVGTKYERGGFSYDKIDCSGLLGKSLDLMGYNITRDDVQSTSLSNGEYEWLGIYSTSDKTRAGNLGMINFYKTNDSKVINHMNYGIGKNNIPLIYKYHKNQIIDATETDSMLIRNDGRIGQYFRAGEGIVNQIYAPFSSNTDPSVQGYIKWQILEEKYKR